MEAQSEDLKKLVKLQRSRTGKKGSITKRIEQLNGMAEAGGCSRRQMKFLLDKLTTVYEELEKVCEEISDISALLDVSDDNNNNIEDIRFNVDCCFALVSEHIDSRQDESSSSGQRTLSWVATLPSFLCKISR